jgi:AraC-like DNA-binding protein
MPGYSFFPPHLRLEAVVEAIWDHDVPDIRSAPTVVMPVVSPTLCFHYRIPPAICFQPCPSPLAENWRQPGRYRITGSQSRAARLRPNGPVGGVMVRLRPEAAARVTGAAMQQFHDAAYSIDDVFRPAEVSLLDERLAEADGPAARVAAVQSFLLRHLRDEDRASIAHHAALLLRRDPTLSVRRLAVLLDVSERHLSRRFSTDLGVPPKQFARIVRIGKVVASARGPDTDWTDVAAACGFSDQAHMINEFNVMVGRPPDAFFRVTSLRDRAAPGASRAESDFYNTFVCEVSSLHPA